MAILFVSGNPTAEIPPFASRGRAMAGEPGAKAHKKYHESRGAPTPSQLGWSLMLSEVVRTA
jgi:hypothetical protein